jgi:hypothetical protein
MNEALLPQPQLGHWSDNEGELCRIVAAGAMLLAPGG